MAPIVEKNNSIDVICQHTRDGNIIPMRIRLVDEDGEYQTYSIKAYKDITNHGSYTMPNGVPSTSHTWTFDCKIQVFNQIKMIRIFYNTYENKWKYI